MRHWQSSSNNGYEGISIHAPRVGCDVPLEQIQLCAHISIHAPRVGCDRSPSGSWSARRAFQSTHPVWGATATTPVRTLAHRYFNPRTPCGVRPEFSKIIEHLPGFQSTHPVWGATLFPRLSFALKVFQSTHPVWGATVGLQGLPLGLGISIHAPRVGCDSKSIQGTR